MSIIACQRHSWIHTEAIHCLWWKTWRMSALMKTWETVTVNSGMNYDHGRFTSWNSFWHIKQKKSVPRLLKYHRNTHHKDARSVEESVKSIEIMTHICIHVTIVDIRPMTIRWVPWTFSCWERYGLPALRIRSSEYLSRKKQSYQAANRIFQYGCKSITRRCSHSPLYRGRRESSNMGALPCNDARTIWVSYKPRLFRIGVID